MNIAGLNLPTTTTHTPVKLYADASEQDGLWFAGCVYSDHNGRPLDTTGFALGKGFKTHEAEMEAINRGVTGIGSYNQVQHLKVLTDSKIAARRIAERSLGEQFETVTIKWIPREKNSLADLVANSYLSRHVVSSLKSMGRL